MSLNRPTVNTDNISFGPAVVYYGVIGATPTAQLGAIKTDDGVTVEFTSTKRDITQGNPKIVEYTFVQEQGAMLKFGSIEWDLLSQWYRTLGSGITASAGSLDSISWGGDPLLTQVAIHVVHQMPVSGGTLNVHAWKCVPDAPPAMAFGHDEHSFDLAFKCQRAVADWNGTSLAYNEQLIEVTRQTA